MFNINIHTIKENFSFFKPRNYYSIILFLSVSILLSTYTLEVFLNYPPCKLCEYQRFPYFFLIFLAIISFFIPKYSYLNFFSLISLVSVFLVSSFHSLVERQIVTYDIGCTSSSSEFENIEDLRNFLEKVPLTKCDEISFSILGLSLANINLIISFVLIIYTIHYLRRYEKKI